jgi:NADP-dependent 3-hydroxy acid dehydrogenase YdfG
VRKRAGGEVAYARTDVKQRDDLSNLVKLACERYRKLDVLVNNAGIGPVSLLDDLRVEDWEEMIDINIKGVLYGIAAALPVFRRDLLLPHWNRAAQCARIRIQRITSAARTKYTT